MTASFSTDLIITTYNNPKALLLALDAIAQQTYQVNKIYIADDGSTATTKTAISEASKKHTHLSIQHVWHPDCGFNKNAILNSAINGSEADYLIFIDGDCIPHPNFVERHIVLAREGRFVTGSVIRLDEKTSKKITTENIKSAGVFSYSWLLTHNQIDRLGTKLKTNFYGTKISSILECLSPVKKVWNGGNTSGWRADIIRVNGFDETLKYGAEDVELGVRLNNLGVTGRHIRYSAPLLHLDHPRGYADKDQLLKNKAYVKTVKKQGLKWTKFGLKKEVSDQASLQVS